MVDFVELQYAMMISNRLQNYIVKSRAPYKINFRCTYCGDSKKSQSAARGWLLETKEQSFVYYCHNCHASTSFLNFLKHVDSDIYKDFITEKYVSKLKKPTEMPVTEKLDVIEPVFDKHPLKRIKKISQLKFDHPVKKYIEERKIPANQHFRIFYAPKFKTWVNTILPDKFDFTKDEPRLILPFLDDKGHIFGLSARSFDPKSSLRYMSLMFYDDRDKIFGLDRVNFNQPYTVLEGAIDSLFLKNSIAMAGADGNLESFDKPENAIIVFDNEPRNKQIHDKMLKVLKQGFKVCVWPEHIMQKDVNEMVLAGVTDIDKIIKDNTFKGLSGELKLNKWKHT